MLLPSVFTQCPKGIIRHLINDSEKDYYLIKNNYGFIFEKYCNVSEVKNRWQKDTCNYPQIGYFFDKDYFQVTFNNYNKEAEKWKKEVFNKSCQFGNSISHPTLELRQNNMIAKILENIEGVKFEESPYYNETKYIQIPLKKLELFLDIQLQDPDICFAYLGYLDIDFDWNKNLLLKYGKCFDWELLQKNPNVVLDFDIIRINKDYINWVFVNGYSHLNWTKKELLEFKNYLVFDRTQTNKLGKRFELRSRVGRDENYFYYNFPSSFNSVTFLNWTPEIIDCITDYWDWNLLSRNESLLKHDWFIVNYLPDLISKEKIVLIELVKNESLEWNEEITKIFLNKLENIITDSGVPFNNKSAKSIYYQLNSELRNIFSYFSRSTKFHWNLDLLERYKNYWDWFFLSINPSLPWSEDLIDKYYEKWNWKNLSGNPNLPWSLNFLKKHENKFVWKSIHDSWKEAVNNPFISNNMGIKWDYAMVKTFEEKIDFFALTFHGNIDEEVFLGLNYNFDKQQIIHTHYQKCSDWRPDIIHTYSTPWENFRKNSKIVLNRKILDYLQNRTSIIASQNETDEYNKFRIYKRTCVISIFINYPLDFFHSYEVLYNDINGHKRNFDPNSEDFKIINYFLNPEFINYHLYTKFIRPYLDKISLVAYLDFLEERLKNNEYL